MYDRFSWRPNLRRSALSGLLRGERFLGAAFQLCSGGEEPVGAGFYLAFFEVVEDVGRRALGDDAFLEGLAGAELENHDVGAVAECADTRGGVERILEEDRGLVADGRLGYEVAGAGDVSGFELLDIHQGGEDLPVGHADGLEVLQVDRVVYATVGVKILVTDLESLYHRGFFKGTPPYVRVLAVAEILQ